MNTSVIQACRPMRGGAARSVAAGAMDDGGTGHQDRVMPRPKVRGRDTTALSFSTLYGGVVA